MFPTLQNVSKGDLSDLMMMHPRCEQNPMVSDRFSPGLGVRRVRLKHRQASSSADQARQVKLRWHEPHPAIRQCGKANAIVYGILMDTPWKNGKKWRNILLIYYELFANTWTHHIYSPISTRYTRWRSEPPHDLIGEYLLQIDDVQIFFS